MRYRTRRSSTKAPILALTLAILFPVGSSAAGGQVTTVLLARHAEKNAEASDPSLTPEGHARARELARVVADAGVVAIYSSQFARTRETAQPLADLLELPMKVVPIERERLDKHLAELPRRILEHHVGQTVLVVGHSNTLPTLIRNLGAAGAPELSDGDYDDLFVVTVAGEGAAQLLHLHFGESSP